LSKPSGFSSNTGPMGGGGGVGAATVKSD
jgi:hypothetical protein